MAPSKSVEAENREIVQELGEKPVTLDLDFGHIVVVDGIPVAKESMVQKLEAAITKRFLKHSVAPKKCHTFLTEQKGTLKTNGFAFLEFENAEEARKVVKAMDGKKMDNKHIMRVSSYNDFLKYIDTPEDLPDLGRDPEKEEWMTELRANLKSWAVDPLGRDMYAVRHADECEIVFNDPVRNSKTGFEESYVQSKDNDHGPRDQLWAERNIFWSPQGSILATQHAQGVRLWGGQGFHILAQFRHQEASNLIFSPEEKFLVTSNGRAPKKAGDEPATIVWNIFTEQAIHSFPPLTGPFQLSWSHDDQFISQLLPDRVRLFKVHSDRLEELDSLNVKGVEHLRWSPDQHLFAYSVPEQDNIPCRVALARAPSLQTVRERQLYRVAKATLQWQAGGDFLSVKMERHKKGKPAGTNIEVFRIREKDFPVETLEFPETVFDFQWEPQGRQLAVIHGDLARKVDLFAVQKKKVKLAKSFEGQAVSLASWAPQGGYLVLVGPAKGHLEFLDTVNKTSVVTRSHYRMNDLGWSPDGQFLITACCTVGGGEEDWKLSGETGYHVWSKLGEQLLDRKLDRCFKVAWRPRPRSLLSAKERAKVRTDLKQKYWKRFEQEDEEVRLQLQGSEAQEQHRLREQWRAFRAEAAERFQEEETFRREHGLTQKYPADEFVEVERVVDHELEVRAEVISGSTFD